jgi:ADP-ribosylglycohydrolase
MAVGIALELDATPPEAVLDAMVSAAARHDVVTAQMAEQAVADALTGTSSDEVLGRLEGWAAHEAIAAAMFVIARCPEDVSEGLLLGANTTGDSDSIATLAGALLGARLGIEAFPVEWVRDVERSAELLVLADRACAVRARK